MKSINLETNESIVNDWVEIYHDCVTCEDFEKRESSPKWRHCPICLEERNVQGTIKHKEKLFIIN